MTAHTDSRLVHDESVGPGRTLRMQLERPWLFDADEVYPELGGLKQRIQIGDFVALGRGLFALPPALDERLRP